MMQNPGPLEEMFEGDAACGSGTIERCVSEAALGALHTSTYCCQIYWFLGARGVKASPETWHRCQKLAPLLRNSEKHPISRIRKN